MDRDRAQEIRQKLRASDDLDLITLATLLTDAQILRVGELMQSDELDYPVEEQEPILKLCPLCGDLADWGQHGESLFVHCLSRCCEAAARSTKEEAATVWNKRHAESVQSSFHDPDSGWRYHNGVRYKDYPDARPEDFHPNFGYYLGIPAIDSDEAKPWKYYMGIPYIPA